VNLTKFIVLCTLSIFLIGCNKAKDKNKLIENKTSVNEATSEDKNANGNNDNSDMKNIVEDKDKIKMPDNSKNISNLELRNSTFVDEYIKGLDLVKEFCKNNSLNLKYAQPIKDRIVDFNFQVVDENSLLLKELYLAGAETVNYFTEEERLNVDLSIATIPTENPKVSTYSGIIYKASIENIDGNFNFKDSKLNEFRNALVEVNDLDYEKIDNYIKDMISKKIKAYMVFFNKIDDDRYEIIKVENNNCYYRLIYDPKL
jgi:hypothetical protein